MRIGLQVPSFTWPGGPAQIGSTWRGIARDADQGGLDSLWVMDHFFQIGYVGPAEEPMLECYSALSYAAAVTERITLGAMVTGTVYRHPGVLVKTVTTLDVLSGGRAWLGIGAAWNQEESQALGIPFPPVAERFERLEETLKIALQMWAGDETAVEGRHYQLGRPLNSPQALQRPHPPILIGGGGEKKTLRLVAKYADACNLFDSPELPHKLAVLKEHCERENRQYGEISKTVLSGFTSVSEAVDKAAALAGEGVDEIIYSQADAHEPGLIDKIVEAAGQVEKLTPAGR